VKVVGIRELRDDELVEFLEDCLREARTGTNFGLASVVRYGSGEIELCWYGLKADVASGLVSRLQYHIHKQWDGLI